MTLGIFTFVIIVKSVFCNKASAPARKVALCDGAGELHRAGRKKRSVADKQHSEGFRLKCSRDELLPCQESEECRPRGVRVPHCG
jgi:hypothetical protein